MLPKPLTQLLGTCTPKKKPTHTRAQPYVGTVVEEEEGEGMSSHSRRTERD
jgi:hypothetical protein